MPNENIQPSDWFKEKWQSFQKSLEQWHEKSLGFKDVEKRVALQNARWLAEGKELVKRRRVDLEKDNGDAVKEEKKEDESVKEEADEDKAKEEGKEIKVNGSTNGDDKTSEEDLLAEFGRELEKYHNDVLGVEDVVDIGNGEPLFSNFAIEDWAFLRLRFQLHLLLHAVSRDNDDKDPAVSGIPADDISFYYNKYYGKELSPKLYGKESLADVLELVKDTVIAAPELFETTILDDLEDNEIFIKLTEEDRRERKLRDVMLRFDGVLDDLGLAPKPPPQPVGMMHAGMPALSKTGAPGLPGMPPPAMPPPHGMHPQMPGQMRPPMPGQLPGMPPPAMPPPGGALPGMPAFSKNSPSGAPLPPPGQPFPAGKGGAPPAQFPNYTPGQPPPQQFPNQGQFQGQPPAGYPAQGGKGGAPLPPPGAPPGPPAGGYAGKSGEWQDWSKGDANAAKSSGWQDWSKDSKNWSDRGGGWQDWNKSAPSANGGWSNDQANQQAVLAGQSKASSGPPPTLGPPGAAPQMQFPGGKGALPPPGGAPGLPPLGFVPSKSGGGPPPANPPDMASVGAVNLTKAPPQPAPLGGKGFK